jgi:hypothetical protein
LEFAVREYTLVFRRLAKEEYGARAQWSVARPALGTSRARVSRGGRRARAGIAQVLVVPICSTLALDEAAYESFLRTSGALDEALELLRDVSLADATAVETARRRIHALIMAAEVQVIVERLSA